MSNMPHVEETLEWVWVDATYLREQAHRCARLARDCPHLTTSHQLEAIGIDLMQKAAELDELQQTGQGDNFADRANRVVTTPKK